MDIRDETPNTSMKRMVTTVASPDQNQSVEEISHEYHRFIHRGFPLGPLPGGLVAEMMLVQCFIATAEIPAATDANEVGRINVPIPAGSWVMVDYIAGGELLRDVLATNGSVTDVISKREARMVALPDHFSEIHCGTEPVHATDGPEEIPEDQIRALYRWSAGFGRMGTLDGLVVATPAELARADGHSVYFGEVLGKYSDVWYDIDLADFELLSSDQGFIDQAMRLGLLDTGTDPIDELGPWCEAHECFDSDERRCPECADE